MKVRVILIFSCLALFTLGFTQEIDFKSIHQEESEYYQIAGNIYSSNQIETITSRDVEEYKLTHRVFGYHPFWAGNDHLNYQWDLLSDLCYFSYEVEPSTGNPITTHEWDTSPAIDSALNNGVNVHLCVTLFAGHYTFFQNPDAQQTLIENIITLIQSRDAQGVNMDIEALPSSLGNEFTNFIIDLNEQMNQIIPEAELSIASPAVNWSGTFDIPILKENIDFFMVMGYDYYWNGSSQAGPVSPLYSMTGNYDYNFSKTMSYYQSQGVPVDKLIMGVPYYGRQWPTSGQYAPSSITGSGTAYTYRYVQLNTSIYSNENKHWEPNSFSPYYSFNNNGWYQCFVEDTYSLGKKYDQIARRNLTGVGIWALGYDNGFTELWQLIADKFTETASPVLADTIFDTGGPSYDYYDNEEYTYTISASENSNIFLSFSYLNLEDIYDSLWIYDGPDTLSPLIGGFTGSTVPTLIYSSTNAITLKFISDNGITNAGWRAVYDTVPVSSIEKLLLQDYLVIYPNPASNKLSISFPYNIIDENVTIQILNSQGAILKNQLLIKGQENLQLNVSNFARGIYFVILKENNKVIDTQKLLVK